MTMDFIVINISCERTHGEYPHMDNPFCISVTAHINVRYTILFNISSFRVFEWQLRLGLSHKQGSLADNYFCA